MLGRIRLFGNLTTGVDGVGFKLVTKKGEFWAQFSVGQFVSPNGRIRNGAKITL